MPDWRAPLSASVQPIDDENSMPKFTSPGCKSLGGYKITSTSKAFLMSANERNVYIQIKNIENSARGKQCDNGCGLRTDISTSGSIEVDSEDANAPGWWRQSKTIIDEANVSTDLKWACCGGSNWQALSLSNGKGKYWSPEGGDSNLPSVW